MMDWRIWTRAHVRGIDTGAGIAVSAGSLALLAHFLLGPRNLDLAYMESIVPSLLAAAQVTFFATGISFVVGLLIGFLVGWAKTVRPVAPVAGDRPFGVIVLVVVFLLLAIGSAIGAVQSLAAAYDLRADLWFRDRLPLLWAVGLANAAVAGLTAIAPIGVWRLRRWGWFLAVVAVLANLVTQVAALLASGISALGLASVAIIPSVLLLYIFIAAQAFGIHAPLLTRGANRVVRRLAEGYVELMRGTPLFVQIVFMWSIFLFKAPVQSAGLSAGLLAGIVAMTLNTGAYQGEIFRGGLQTVHTGQVEAARAIGLTRWQTMGYIVLPQALRLIIPPLTNEFVALLKASSLMFFVGVAELTFVSKQLSSREVRIFEVFAVVTGIYLLMTVPLSKVVEWVERRYRIPGLGIQAGRDERVPVPAKT